MSQGFSIEDEKAAISSSIRRSLARRRVRRPGETKIRARCDKCGRVLADLLGDHSGIRYISAHRVSAILNDEGGWEIEHSGPRRATEYVFWSGLRGQGNDFASIQTMSERRRFICHKKCGADIPFRIEKLEKAFQGALRSGRPEVSLPRDL